jgi:hypothetical protein
MLSLLFYRGIKAETIVENKSLFAKAGYDFFPAMLAAFITP